MASVHTSATKAGKPQSGSDRPPPFSTRDGRYEIHFTDPDPEKGPTSAWVALREGLDAPTPAEPTYAIAWYSVLADPGLTPGEKLVWLALQQWGFDVGRACNPSNEQIGRAIGASAQWARAHLHALKEKGFLEIIDDPDPKNDSHRILVRRLPLDPTWPPYTPPLRSYTPPLYDRIPPPSHDRTPPPPLRSYTHPRESLEEPKKVVRSLAKNEQLSSSTEGEKDGGSTEPKPEPEPEPSEPQVDPEALARVVEHARRVYPDESEPILSAELCRVLRKPTAEAVIHVALDKTAKAVAKKRKTGEPVKWGYFLTVVANEGADGSPSTAAVGPDHAKEQAKAAVAKLREKAEAEVRNIEAWSEHQQGCRYIETLPPDSPDALSHFEKHPGPIADQIAKAERAFQRFIAVAEKAITEVADGVPVSGVVLAREFRQRLESARESRELAGMTVRQRYEFQHRSMAERRPARHSLSDEDRAETRRLELELDQKAATDRAKRLEKIRRPAEARPNETPPALPVFVEPTPEQVASAALQKQALREKALRAKEKGVRSGPDPEDQPLSEPVLAADAADGLIAEIMARAQVGPVSTPAPS